MPTLVKIHPYGAEEFKECGPMVDAIKWSDDGKIKEIIGHEPIVGCSLMVGSVNARSYSDQDYWLTTEVTEIVEKTEDYIIFKTKNSTYKLF